MIAQATTPTFVLTLPETVDLSVAENVYFSMRQGFVHIEKSTNDLNISGQDVSVFLTQAETLQLSEGKVQIQLNWTYSGGVRACSDIVEISVSNNLLKRVVA